jgi:L-iditol 2-dehydrogenase
MVDLGKTMAAAVFVGEGRIEIRELPIPKPGSGEVLLRVEACGVCGTDNHILRGELTDGVFPPVVLGHEIAARVAQPGPGVDGLEPGQLVAVDPLIGCGCCPACRSARPNLCAAPTTIGYKLNGGYAQYLVAPASKLVPLSDSAGVLGGVLCETLACVLNGYDRLAPRPGATALILGAGTVGLLWLQLLLRSPLSRVIQTEVASFRRGKARKLGVGAVIDPEAEDLADAVHRELGGGADYIIDATGDPGAVERALPMLAPGGTFMIFGVCPEGSEVRFDPFVLYNKEAKIIASKMPPATLDRSARLIASGAIACEEIITATLGLKETPHAVAAFNEHRDSQVRLAIDPWA